MNNENSGGNSGRTVDDNLDGRVLAAVKGLLVVVGLAGSIIGAHYSTKASLEGDIRETRQQLEHTRESLSSEAGRLRQYIDSVSVDVRAHTTRGPDGLPHPEGIIVILKGLESRLAHVEKELEKRPK